MKDMKFVYDLKQANFFMREGVRCLGVGKHRETGKIFFMFNHYECQDAYKKWIKNKIDTN